MLVCLVLSAAGLLASATVGDSFRAVFVHHPVVQAASERVLVLGESGQIIRGRVGDILDVQLGGAEHYTSWQFTCIGHGLRVTPIYTTMPRATPPAVEPENQKPVQQDDGHYYISDGPTTDAPQTVKMAVPLVRITLVAPGVTTVKGWRVQYGADHGTALPDFYFVVLARP